MLILLTIISEKGPLLAFSRTQNRPSFSEKSNFTYTQTLTNLLQDQRNYYYYIKNWLLVEYFVMKFAVSLNIH